MLRVRSSAPSLIMLTSKGLTPISSLRFSPWAFSAHRRAKSLARFQVSPLGSSRRWRTLNEPDGTCTRVARRLWSEPRWRIFTDFNSRGLDFGGESSRYVPVAPLPNEGQERLSLWDRSSGLLLQSKDYAEQPPSNVASQSPGTTLYGSRA